MFFIQLLLKIKWNSCKSKNQSIKINIIIDSISALRWKIVKKFCLFTICSINLSLLWWSCISMYFCHVVIDISAVGIAICFRALLGRVIRWFQCHAEGDRIRQRELLNRFVQFPPGDRDPPSQSATSPQQRYHPRRAVTYSVDIYGVAFALRPKV